MASTSAGVFHIRGAVIILPAQKYHVSFACLPTFCARSIRSLRFIASVTMKENYPYADRAGKGLRHQQWQRLALCAFIYATSSYSSIVF